METTHIFNIFKKTYIHNNYYSESEISLGRTSHAIKYCDLQLVRRICLYVASHLNPFLLLIEKIRYQSYHLLIGTSVDSLTHFKIGDPDRLFSCITDTTKKLFDFLLLSMPTIFYPRYLCTDELSIG